MSDIEVVLDRLDADHEFRCRLGADPRAALEPYALTRGDLSLLAERVAGGRTAVERRTSKSVFFALFSQLDETAGPRALPTS